MIFHPTPIDGLVLIEAETRGDERGSLARVYCTDEFAAAGIDHPIVQANVTHTAAAGTVRGMHYQQPPSSEGKYVRCTRGALWDVGVDLRQGSPTFGQHWGVELDEENGLGLLLPRGVAHGMQTLVDGTEASYLVSAAYDPAAERGLRHDDPALGIVWPMAVTVVSDKDRSWPDFGPSAAVRLDVRPAPEETPT